MVGYILLTRCCVYNITRENDESHMWKGARKEKKAEVSTEKPLS